MESDINTSKSVKYKLNFAPDAMKNLKIKFKISKPKICICDSKVHKEFIKPSLTLPHRELLNPIQCFCKNSGFAINKNLRSNYKIEHSHIDFPNKLGYLNTISSNGDFNHTMNSKLLAPEKGIGLAKRNISLNKNSRNQVDILLPKCVTTTSDKTLYSYKTKEADHNEILYNISQEKGKCFGRKNGFVNAHSFSKSTQFAIFNHLDTAIQSSDSNNGDRIYKRHYNIPKSQFLTKLKKDSEICSIKANINNSLRLAQSKNSSEMQKLRPCLSLSQITENSQVENAEKSKIKSINTYGYQKSHINPSLNQLEMIDLKKLISNGRVDRTTHKLTNYSKPLSKKFVFPQIQNDLEDAHDQISYQTKPTLEFRKAHHKSSSLQESLNCILQRTKKLIEASKTLD